MKGKLSLSSSTRSRCFSLSTYLNEGQILRCLLNHVNQVRVYAYAYHDKDVYPENDDRAGELKEPHTHILLITYSATTLSAVRRWFYGFTDEDGEQINTLGQICKDKYAYYDYLTHSDPNSRNEGKYRYPDEIIKCNDYEFFAGHSQAELDSANLIIDSMMKGVDYQTLRRRFGRDFILNFDKYKFYCEQEEVHGKYNLTEEWVKNARIEREIKLKENLL